MPHARRDDIVRRTSAFVVSIGLMYGAVLATSLDKDVAPALGAERLPNAIAGRVSASPTLLFAFWLAVVAVAICLERWLRAGQRQGLLLQRIYVASSIATAILVAVPVFFAQQMALHRAINALLFPFPMDYGEGQILDQVSRLAHGLPIYFTSRGTQTPPYTIANYPPLYQLVQVPFAWVFGTAFWYGRLISVLSVLMSGVSIALIVHATTKDWAAGAIGGLTTLCMPPVYLWAPLVRVDQLALGLSLTGLYIAVRWPRRTAALSGAAACFVAAAYTKQSYVLTAPLAAVAWLWSQNERQRAVFMAALVGGTGVVIFTLVTLLTGGGFYFNIVTATARGDFSWPRVFATLIQIFRSLPLLVLGSGLFVLLGFCRKVRPVTWALVTAYLTGAVVGAVAIGKNGSNMNYLYELSAAFGLVTGAAVGWPTRAHRWATLILALIVASQIRSMVSWSLMNYSSLNGVFTQRAELAELAQLVRETEGPVLADETMGLIPLAGKTVLLQPFEFKQLYDAGIWNDEKTAEDIYGQRYAVILVRRSIGGWDNLAQRWTPRQRAALEASYEVSRSYNNNLVYRPRKQ
jgi:hypothetical protein